MLEIDFSGPHALLSNEDDIPYLLAAPTAWTAGIYLWTFLYNQAHRVNRVGFAHDSVAAAHNDHLGAFFSGQRPVYRATDLAAGTVSPVYTPSDDHGTFVAEFPEAMRHLAALRVFYAPVDGPDTLRERIATAITAHFQRLGGKAVAWLDNDPVSYDANAYADPITLRLGRPAFIASLPDEMHL